MAGKRDKVRMISYRYRPLLHHGQEQEEHPGKMEFLKYDPVVRKHVLYKEGKIK